MTDLDPQTGSPERSRRHWRGAIAIALWVAAIGLAGMYDARVAAWMHAHGVEGFLRAHRGVREVLKAPGFYGFTIALAVVVWLTHRFGWRAAAFLLIATAASGVSSLMKWIAGRYRPYKFPGERPGSLLPFDLHPFPGSGTNLSFPSGHTCLAFATACAMGMLWPRGRPLFYALATLVALERVGENAHWASDAVAAAALGIAVVHAVRWIARSLGVDPELFSAPSSEIRNPVL